MRDSLMIEVRLRRFGAWRSAVLGLASVALAALAAWTWSTVASAGSSAGVLAIACVLALATIGAAASLLRVPRGVLALANGVWSFAQDGRAAVAGALTVAIDWGAFLLLRLDGPTVRVWLPVQRRGLEREWHALRCAVYAARREDADSAADAAHQP